MYHIKDARTTLCVCALNGARFVNLLKRARVDRNVSMTLSDKRHFSSVTNYAAAKHGN